MAAQKSDLDWRDGQVPISQRFDDPYYSLENGLAETRHVFLSGNGLPERFHDGFHIAELGFGTGLNFLSTLNLWRRSGQVGTLHYTSFEAYPLKPSEMDHALSAFPELADLVTELQPHWGKEKITLPGFSFHLIEGDARKTLPLWEEQADAWFLDGFSPAKNPELWQEDLMSEVFTHTADHGTVATYTAAGFVRRGLEHAGFAVSRAPGYGRKRHMTCAVKKRA